jgi:hypothetical protein
MFVCVSSVHKSFLTKRERFIYHCDGKRKIPHSLRMDEKKAGKPKRLALKWRKSYLKKKKSLVIKIYIENLVIKIWNVKKKTKCWKKKVVENLKNSIFKSSVSSDFCKAKPL